MRTISLSLFALFLSATILFAQSDRRPVAVPGKPTIDPKTAELDGYLERWEHELKKIKTFAAKCGWTEKSPITGTDKFRGSLHFERPNKFLLHVNKVDPITKRQDPNEFQRVLSTGTHLYQYVPAEKVIRVYKAFNTDVKGQSRQQTAMEFFFNMNADKAKRRFDLKLAKTDKNYVYIDVFPKAEGDKAEFVQARLVLLKSTMMPYQLWFKSSVNQEEVLWEIPLLQQGVKIDKETFSAPDVPKGWKMVKAQPATKSQKRPVFRNQDR